MARFYDEYQITQPNRAPVGYGQQDGSSPFLNRRTPEEEQEEAYRRQIAMALGDYSDSEYAQPRYSNQRRATDTGEAGYSYRQPSPIEMALGGEEDQGPAPRMPRQQNRFTMPPLQAEKATQQPGGQWGANYEWQGAEGGPRVSDLAVGDPSRLTGFNTAGWGTGERGTESFKNTFGRIASRYEARPSSLQQIVNDPDFKQFFPDAQVVGFDKIDFGDGNPVDVLVSADPNADTANAWAFQTGGGSPALPSAPADFTGAGLQSTLGDNSQFNVLAQQLGLSSVDIQRLLDQILSEQDQQSYISQAQSYTPNAGLRF